MRRTLWVVEAGCDVECGIEPIGAPLPCISGHGVETIIIGREGVDRARSCVSIVAGVFFGELALPDIHAMLSVGAQRIAPRMNLLHKAASCRVLPLCFCRQ